MNPAKFCTNMKQYRENANLSFTELSARLLQHGVEISAPTLQRYESGKIKNVPYDTIVILALIFHIEPATLMGWDTCKTVSHRTTKLDERLSDFIQELITRNTKFTLNNIELDSEDIRMLIEMLEHNISTMGYLLKAKQKK